MSPGICVYLLVCGFASMARRVHIRGNRNARCSVGRDAFSRHVIKDWRKRVNNTLIYGPGEKFAVILD